MKFLPSGDCALVVEFGDVIDRELNEKVVHLSKQIQRAQLAGLLETVATFRSVMVYYDPLTISFDALKEQITGMVDEPTTTTGNAQLVKIPVCYETEFAPDLADVAERTSLGADAVVQAHCARKYHVYMLGFVPGFPYMGDLPAELQLPRRVDPRPRVPAGSIAIAQSMTALYPIESPGGWHLIGRTPLVLFDVDATPPALLLPGDVVEFEVIDRYEFRHIERAVVEGDFRPDKKVLRL